MSHQILPKSLELLRSIIEALKKSRRYFSFSNEKILVIFMGERYTAVIR